LSKKKGAGEGSDGAHLDVVRSSSSHALVTSLLCPHHRMVVVLSPSSAHMVVPSPSCVSARWVGMNVGWGYSPWHPKLHNDDERRMSLVVRHLVATSLTAMWHLDAMLERSVVGASELAHLVSLLYVVRRVAPWSFVCRWLPCRRCLFLV